MPLDKYQSMRDFDRTDEPPGEPVPEPSEFERAGTPRFVVQEHHATSLHWDFRIEREGVLVSWAVPKGIPPDPRVNTLAIHTEDHPLSYIDFAGEIPKGEYGGGQVYLWDQGTYELEKYGEREVMVVLHGERVRGRYVLFQTDGRNWMMHRMDPPEDPARELMPDDLRPLEAVPGELPRGDGWRHLVAWGGTTATVAVEGGRCTARTAGGEDVTSKWPELGAFGRRVGALPVVFVAELVRSGGKGSGSVMLADVVWLDGHPTTSLPFDDRRRLLEGLELDGPGWKTTPTFTDGALLLDAARRQGLPGILCLRGHAPYEPPRFVAS